MPRHVKAKKHTNLVRASRDGDQFHYLWAARRCLNLLALTGPLKAVTIEGSSPSESAGRAPIAAGEEVIDLAEYYGADAFEHAERVRYVQVKHSTVRTNQALTASGLQKTVKGFAGRFKELRKTLSAEALREKVEFVFVSNRPVSTAYIETIEDAASGATLRHPVEFQKLKKVTNLSDSDLALFCALIKIEAGEPGLWDQRNILRQDISFYLADADVDAPTQLKELVTLRALSNGQTNPTITRLDVLRALKTDESALFPAPCLIQKISNVVPREQEQELIRDVFTTQGAPVVVHAAGGVGKSVIATRIQLGLPEGSVCIVYDCFSNGQYRSATGYRHRHKDALVQIANELAALGLCHPLISTQNADNSAYLKSFLHRIRQSVSSLRTTHHDALLCIVIDAADNAQMAAEEIGEAQSFIRDLIREPVPDGVRLVALCRTHRQHFLDPPPSAVRLELKSFSEKETANHLRGAFPDASDEDVKEFHRLTSQNPRVQALALSQSGTIGEVLRRLGPNPTTVDDVIGSLLDQSIVKLKDTAGGVEKSQVDKICAGLAALRPLIPISVLSAMSGVDAAAIRSFAYDLGRPLLVNGDTIQFFDEPAETWFRDRFKPSAGELVSFISELKPLASSSAYVAAALPQLMLEAGHFDELVALALSTEALPEGSPLERRDVELQRLQFALKASLRAKRYTDAAKLALKAGGESAGDERQRKMLQENTDLTSAFMDGGRLQEIVSRRTFGSGWIGSHHAYEAGLMSGRAELLGDARSRLRMAWEWVMNWSRQPADERKDEQITDEDIAEIAMAFFNIHGAESCAKNLRGWKPRQVSFRAGRILARRFVDHGRYEDLDELALAAGDDGHLVLAVILELRQVSKAPSKEAIKRAFKFASNPRLKIKDIDRWDHTEVPLQAVLALVEAAYRLNVCNAKKAAALLTRYLPDQPPRGLSSRFSSPRVPLLQGYALRAAFEGKTLDLIDLAHPELRKELEEKKASHSDSRDAQEFKEDVGALLPWHLLWAETIMKGVLSDIAKTVSDTLAASSTAARIHHREEWRTTDEIAKIWLDILILSGATDSGSMQRLTQWIDGLRRPLFTPTLAHLARVATRTPPLEGYGLDFAKRSYDLTKGDRSDAEQQASGFAEVARAVLVASQSEAAAYFDEAIAVASKIGSENLDRWGAFLDLADRAAVKEAPAAELAYRLGRCAELTYVYVVRDKHFDWESTVRAIAGLCPSSSLAILSRWRDRKFGSARRLLPAVVNFLIERGDLHARAALALIGFRAEWDANHLLGPALAGATTPQQKRAIWSSVESYITTEHRDSKGWTAVQAVLLENNLAKQDIDERVKIAEANEVIESRRQSGSYGTGVAETYERDWNAIFGNADLDDPNAISAAYDRFKALDPPYYLEHFYREAFRRVRTGNESEFIRAFGDAPEFDLYDFRNFLDQVPTEWRKRVSTKAAFEATLRKFCRRYCMKIMKSRYYEVLPFRVACELSGIPETAVVDEVLEAVGEATEVITAGRLFTLVGLLAIKLSPSEAADALSFGLNLIEGVLEQSDGDGPWRPELAPPREVSTAVAGYVWAALASPYGVKRWEAAHVVRLLCALGEVDVVDHLIAFAKGSIGGPFVDAGLDFYALHAKQWLLIGLARAALESPAFVARHAAYLTETALQAEPHVLIRQFARRTVLALVQSGAFKPTDDAINQLAAVNVSPFQMRLAKSYQRDATDVKNDDLPEDDRYYFGMDFGPYWLAPLGRIFSMSQNAVEHTALSVIREDWRQTGKGRWSDDERQRRKLFRDMESYHHHGSAPKAEDTHFYFSYHAMMVTAGKLLASVPIYRDPEGEENEFESWLSGYDLTRRDGHWLSDRRDASPAEMALWKTQPENDEWLSSISKEDFERALRSSDDRICVWGDWTEASGRLRQEVHIYSALVSRDRSMALARALETAHDPHDYRVPDAEDALQIDFKGYRLAGWVVDRTREGGLDERDPWSGGICWPAPRPSGQIKKLTNLRAGPECREWFAENPSDSVLRSKVWGTFKDGDEDDTPERGDRLDASISFISRMLRTVDADMILKVEINRRHRYSRYESNHETQRIPPSARLFIIRADGSVTTVSGTDSTRKESRQRAKAA